MKIRTLGQIILLVFMIYIIYQIIIKLLGGSWSIEELILALVVINIGWTGALQKLILQQTGDIKLIKYRLSSVEQKVSKLESLKKVNRFF